MFFLAATLVGWIGGDFVYRKVAAKNIFSPVMAWCNQICVESANQRARSEISNAYDWFDC